MVTDKALLDFYTRVDVKLGDIAYSLEGWDWEDMGRLFGAFLVRDDKFLAQSIIEEDDLEPVIQGMKKTIREVANG